MYELKIINFITSLIKTEINFNLQNVDLRLLKLNIFKYSFEFFWFSLIY